MTMPNEDKVAHSTGAIDVPASPHASSEQELLKALQSEASGLSDEGAAARREQFGRNEMPTVAGTPAWKRLLRQFRSLFIYVLLASGGISYFLGHFVDAGVIIAVVLINGIIGFIQEGKAEEALNSILSMAITHCIVLRDGELQTRDSTELVPGDVVSLQAGDRVPADIRLLQSKELRSDESILTGESEPSDKHCETVAGDAAIAQRHNMVFMGTMIVAGAATGVVTHTGVATQIGAINQLVDSVRPQTTRLQQQLSALARNLTFLVLALSLLIILYGMGVHGYGFAEMLQSAIAIAVAAIPEELPVIVTIVLSIGVVRMARSNALVRRLPAVEVLGSVDIVCTDKTGTLTANAMTVRVIETAAASIKVEGEGYAPQGALSPHDAAWEPVLAKIALIGMLCNDANTTQDEQGHWQVSGDPTEGALIVLARKQGLGRAASQSSYPRLDALPFDSEKRYMATLHADAAAGAFVALKGAPERVLQMCAQQYGANGIEALDLSSWQHKVAALAEQGMRVLALAHKQFPDNKTEIVDTDVQTGMVILALVGISDPPRSEAISAIARCHEAGIRVKMITGDNPITAKAIAKELGLNADKVLTGQDLDAMDDKALEKASETVDIYARTSPANKLQLVAALQRLHHVVAMTGDGVNDAPALRKADIGVAMGLKGTDAAREAGDIVLTDDNFATIAQAVTIGRTVYDNTVKSLLFMLPTQLAEAGVVLLAIIFGWVLPITAPQILWINMVTTVTLSLALAFELTERGAMLHPPRPFAQGLITASVLRRVLLVGLSSTVVTFAVFLWYLRVDQDVDYARTMAVNIVVMIEALYLLNCRFFDESIFHKDMLKGATPVMLSITAVVIGQLLFTYLPISQSIFMVTNISLLDWLVVIAAASVILVLVEIEKDLAKRQARRIK